jgi:uncharacterized protein (TIGR03067 family)
MIAKLMYLAIVALGNPAAVPVMPDLQNSSAPREPACHGLAVKPSVAGRQTEKPVRDRDAILGAWQVVKVEEDGKDVSESDHAKEFRAGTWTITKNKIVLKEGVREMNYELDPFAKPKTLDMDNGGDKRLDCVYSLDGDTLKICAPLNPGGNRPAEVASKKGSGTRLLTLRRPTQDK